MKMESPFGLQENPHDSLFEELALVFRLAATIAEKWLKLVQKITFGAYAARRAASLIYCCLA
jgi:hypothetical protein